MEKFISYGKQWISDDDIAEVIKILRGEYLTQGPAIELFEQKIKEYTGARFAAAVSNATAGLHLAIAACGSEEEAEGITSPITFVASSNALIYNRIKPVFADIERDTYNIDPEAMKRKITDRTGIIVPVHFAGQAVKMEAIKNIADKKNIRIVEDAAHAVGSCYENGKPVGSCCYADCTVFSFHPVKTITTGEGGMITTNSEELYEKILLLRNHGITKNPDRLQRNPGPWYYEMQMLGFNYRMTDIQAALGTAQMKHLESFKKRRQEIIGRYNDAFKEIEWLKIPFAVPALDTCFHLYVLQFDFGKIKKSRTQVMNILALKKIGTQVHYIPVYLQPFYARNYGCQEGNCPAAEEYYRHALSIPLYPKMSDRDVDYVIENIIGLSHD